MAFAHSHGDEIAGRSGRRFSRRRKGLFGAALATTATVGAFWYLRTDIADNIVRQQLDQRGVRASYRIADIGFRTQRLRDVVIGDPANPDLTARALDVVFRIGLSGPYLSRVRAEGVRLHGRIVDGQLRLGELDKLRDLDSKAPLTLPDIYLDANDVRARIVTPLGPVGLSLGGSGNLRDGFEGQFAAIGRELTVGGCNIADASYYGTVAIRSARPALGGPLRFGRLFCAESDVSVARADIAADVALDAGLTSWRGSLGTRIGHWQVGSLTGTSLSGPVNFYGNGRRTQIDADLAARGVASPFVSVATLGIKAAGRIASDRRGLAVGLSGEARISDGRVDTDTVAGLRKTTAGFSGTPLEPVAAGVIDALRRAADRFNGGARISYAYRGDRQDVAIESVELSAVSGATLLARDRMILIKRDAASAWQFGGRGRFSLRGGGFPDVELALAESGDGRLSIAPYQVGGSLLAVPDLRISGNTARGYALNGDVILSGPVAGGRIDTIRIPLTGTFGGRNGGLALFDRCTRFAFARFAMAGLDFRDQGLTLCPAGQRAIVVQDGGGRLRFAAQGRRTDLVGRLGSSPASLAAGNVSIDNGGFTLSEVSFSSGSDDDPTRFAAASLAGRFGNDGTTGTFDGANGKIAKVPLLLEVASGTWRLADGALAADLGGRLLDAEQVDRFLPLDADAVKVTYADGDISMTGRLAEPDTGREVAMVSVRHDLTSGNGDGVLETRGITFDSALQPDMLTPLALGVVANVEGTVSGTGRIVWNEAGVTSSGEYRTAGTNLAAAFGPVRGIGGTIRFSDLLGLETAPGQTLSLASVNSGIEVLDGILRYQLLPEKRVRIEGGRWPFAGGELILQPTVLDLGEEKARFLTFEMTGFDAAKFLANLDVSNLNATGVFDGTLPMVFDSEGGRILNGTLVSRDGGGTIAYVGQLTYEDLSPYGNMAFQALKSIRYRRLSVVMNGDIGGEIITQIKFDGIGQGEGAAQNFITRSIARLPIQFNINITAPFMQLASSIRGYYDPSLLVGQNLPLLLDAQRTEEARRRAEQEDVQRNESGVVP